MKLLFTLANQKEEEEEPFTCAQCYKTFFVKNLDFQEMKKLKKPAQKCQTNAILSKKFAHILIYCLLLLKFPFPVVSYKGEI